MKRHELRPLVDVLRLQDHYFVLHDGQKYARHGTPEDNGVLVFEILERAEQFCMTVGCGLPNFQPRQISAEELLEVAVEVGAVCVAKGTQVIVARIGQTGR